MNVPLIICLLILLITTALAAPSRRQLENLEEDSNSDNYIMPPFQFPVIPDFPQIPFPNIFPPLFPLPKVSIRCIYEEDDDGSTAANQETHATVSAEASTLSVADVIFGER